MSEQTAGISYRVDGKRVYSAEFKQNIVAECRAGTTAAEVARKYRFAAWLTLTELSPTSKNRLNLMTLRHLLSFTSGLEQEDNCIGSNTDHDVCVHALLLKNRTSAGSTLVLKIAVLTETGTTASEMGIADRAFKSHF